MRIRDVLDRLEQFAVDVILERRYGKRAALLRVLLRGLSYLYEGIVRLRLRLYQERTLRSQPVGCLVVSIGNLSVGGTGKTPVVEKFAKALQQGGRRVAVLSRGYKSRGDPPLQTLFNKIFRPDKVKPPRVVSDGRSLLLDSRRAGDEPFMLANNLSGVRVLVDKDRVKSAVYAVKRWGVDTVILDDGFQYFPMGERLDVVLVDSQAPFGNEYLLPRGTLREPPDHIKRADIIFITKCTSSGNDVLKARIRRLNNHAEIVECKHEPLYCQHVYTDERFPLDYLKDLPVVAVSGIAAPDSFERFLKTLGAEILHSRQFADHHRYSRDEIRAVNRRASNLRAKAILTTEKDAVRFPVLATDEVKLPVIFLRVEIRIIGGRESFEECVQRICRQRPRPELIRPCEPMPVGA